MRFVAAAALLALGAVLGGQQSTADPSACPNMEPGDPDSVERCVRSLEGKATERYEMKQFGLVIETCDKAIQLAPHRYFCYFMRGSARLENRNPDGAIEDYDRVIALKPTSDEAYFNRGQAYSTKHEPDRAIPNYDRAIDMQPQNANY